MLGPRELSAAYRYTTRKARFIKIIESDLPLILVGLQGGQFTLTAGKGLRITETL